MDAWLERWKITYHAVSVPRDNGAIRICFRDDSVANAFSAYLGGQLVSPDAVALTADPITETKSPGALVTS